MTIWHMRIACWITKVEHSPARMHTHTHTHTFIKSNTYCFTWQQLLRERTKILRYKYTASLIFGVYSNPA